MPPYRGAAFTLLVEGQRACPEREGDNAAIPTGTQLAAATFRSRGGVLGESEAWVYLQTAAQTFVRTKVDISPPGHGYFSDGIKRATRFWSAAPGLLLAHEAIPAPKPGD